MPGLSFLAPAFLAGLLAVGVPIFLHLFRRRSDRVVEFPAVHMLPDAPVQQQERRQLRDLLLLALRALALVLLAVSFARPYLVGDAAAVGGGTTLVAVDRSLSTSAPATWAEIQRRARAAIDAAPAAHLVGLMTFDDRGRVVAAPSAARDEARAALETLTPGAGGTSFAAAIGSALDAMHGARGRVVVVTDAQQRGWAGVTDVAVPGGVEVVLEAVPPPSENLAVTALRRGAALTAVVQNYATGARTAAVRLRIDEIVVERATVALAPLTAAEVRFTAALPARGVADVTVDDPAGPQGDNRRYWLLAPPRPPAVLVLTADPPESARTGLYVERALQAAEDLWPSSVTVVDGRRYSSAQEDPRPDVLVVVGTRTLDRRGRARLAGYLAGGGQVLLTLGPDIDVPTLGEALGAPIRVAPEPVAFGSEPTAIVPSDRRHPVWRQLAGPRSGLGRVVVERARPLLDLDAWTVLARFDGGTPALAERAVGRGLLLAFTSDVDNRWNRFPIDPAFAPFVVESARYLARGARGTSSFVLPDVPAGVPAAPGRYEVALAPGQPPAPVVVNVDPAESDLTTVTPEAFAAHVRVVDTTAPVPPDDDARAREEQQRLWQFGLAAMLGVLVVEGVLGRGRRMAGAPERVG